MSNPKIKDKLVEIIEEICEPKHIHFDEPGDAPDGCVIINDVPDGLVDKTKITALTKGLTGK